MAGFVVRKSNGMSASLKSTNVGLRGGRKVWLVLWGEPGGLSSRSTGDSGRLCVVFTVCGLDILGVVATGGVDLVGVRLIPMLVADFSAAKFRGFVGGMLTSFFLVFGCTEVLVILISGGDGACCTGLCGGVGRGEGG